jgi:hypothetical protein
MNGLPITPQDATKLADGLGALAPLRSWGPVSALADRVLDALRGGEGLSRTDWQRATTWPVRWSALASPVRAFYAAAHAHHAGVSAVLFQVLEGCPVETGSVYRAWAILYGRPCPYDLAPRLSATTTRENQ